MLIVGRTFLGIASGSLCVVGPVCWIIEFRFDQAVPRIMQNADTDIELLSQVYIGEISEKSIRGALGALTQLMITSGILLVYILGAFASPRTTSIVCGIIPIIFGICMFFCPESPTYFVSSLKLNQRIIIQINSLLLDHER